MDPILQKILDNVQQTAANLDKRLAPFEDAFGKDGVERIGEKLNRVEQIENALSDLKALIQQTQFAVGSDKNYRGNFPSAPVAKNFGNWAAFTLTGDEKFRGPCEDAGFDSKALAEAVTSTGGALVPEEFISTLIVLMESYGVYRRNARLVPMASDRQTWPKLDTDMTATFPGEAGTITASDTTFSNVQLVAKKACALIAISSEIEEDAAVAVGEIIADSIARVFAKAEDQAGFLGDGTSTYWGFTGAAGSLRAVDATIGNIKSLTVAAGNNYSEIILPNFDTVVANYPDYADNQDTKWYMHRYFYWTVVRKLLLAYSSNIPTAGVDPMDVAAGKLPRLLGYPVEFVNVMPKVEANSQICALLANLRMGAFLGTRRGLRIERSREVYFTTDQIGIRGTNRFAINVFGVGDTTDPGPICGLIMAAS